MTEPITYEARTIEWGAPLAEWDETVPAARDPIVAEYRDRALAGTVFAPDAGQNFIVGWGFNLAHSNRGGASFVRKDRTGAVTGAWTTNTPDDQKPDDMGGGQTGDSLAILVLTHEPISEDTRRNRVYLGVLPGVLVPYPAGQPPVGGYVPRAALVGDGSPPPAPQPSEPVDYARIQQTVAAEVDRLIANFGGGSVRGGIMEKVEDGLVRVMSRALQTAPVQNPDAPDAPDAVDPRVAQFQAVFSDTLFNSPGLYQRLNDTVYEVVGKFLDPKPKQEGDNTK